MKFNLSSSANMCSTLQFESQKFGRCQICQSVGGEEKSHTFITSDQKKKLYLKFKMMELAIGRKFFKINVEFLVLEVVL